MKIRTPKYVESTIESGTKRAQTQLLNEFIAWFNNELAYINTKRYLEDTGFTLSYINIPMDFLQISLNKQYVFKPILEKHLKDSGWCCERDNDWWVNIKPITTKRDR